MSNPIKPFNAADLRKLLATAINTFTALNDDGWIPAFSEMELKDIILRGDSQLKIQIAVSRLTPAETLNLLARDSDASVREAVAKNPNTPKSSCFIATAATGSYDHPITATLRGFRDESLEQTVTGRWFVQKYYQISPPFARWIAQRPAARFTIKWVFLYPLVQLIRFFS